MTKLKKNLKRETEGTVYECGKRRKLIVEVAPPDLVGFRPKGTKHTYWITAEAGYSMAVKAEVAARKRENRKPRRRSVKRGII